MQREGFYLEFYCIKFDEYLKGIMVIALCVHLCQKGQRTSIIAMEPYLEGATILVCGHLYFTVKIYDLREHKALGARESILFRKPLPDFQFEANLLTFYWVHLISI